VRVRHGSAFSTASPPASRTSGAQAILIVTGAGDPLSARAANNLAITSITDRLLFDDPRFFERYGVLNFRLDEMAWLAVAIRKDSALHPSHPSYAGPLPSSIDPGVR
jgi:hypothetical protein